jgi:hypothetical protein
VDSGFVIAPNHIGRLLSSARKLFRLDFIGCPNLRILKGEL